MPLADTDTIDVLWIVLSVFLVVVGVALAFLLFRLSGTAKRLTLLLQGLESTVPSLLGRVQGTVERVNLQLDKTDRVTDSAIGAADAADTTLRAVSIAVVRPVQKVSGLAKGVSQGVSTFASGGGFGDSMKAAREAKAQREAQIAEDIGRTDGVQRVIGSSPPDGSDAA